jgi:hypothetical protein
MGKVYKTAQGKTVDIDSLRLVNENTIAVGNMKVNARGDQLGPGGKVAQTRNQTMDQHYKLHTPTANSYQVDNVIQEHKKQGAQVSQGTAKNQIEIQPEEATDPDGVPFDQTPEEPEQPQMRGSLADSIAKQRTVNQELLPPLRKKPTGPQRI